MDLSEKISKKWVHLSRWATLHSWTGPIEIHQYHAVRYFPSVVIGVMCSNNIYIAVLRSVCFDF